MRHDAKALARLHELELLARHYTAIFGRAQDPTAPTQSPDAWRRAQGRPNRIDCASSELTRAYRAMDRLRAMAQEGVEGRRHATIMSRLYVTLGPQARTQREVYIEIALTYLKKKRPKKLTQEAQRMLWEKGLRLANAATRAYLKLPAEEEE